jgi:hypothetical protein
MSEILSTPLCDECKKPMRKNACLACNGSGHYQERGSFIGKRICQNCKGSGQVWQCEDWIKHSEVKAVYRPFNQKGRLPGESTTDAPPSDQKESA